MLDPVATAPGSDFVDSTEKVSSPVVVMQLPY
jgi:hypothetical protein